MQEEKKLTSVSVTLTLRLSAKDFAHIEPGMSATNSETSPVRSAATKPTRLTPKMPMPWASSLSSIPPANNFTPQQHAPMKLTLAQIRFLNARKDLESAKAFYDEVLNEVSVEEQNAAIDIDNALRRKAAARIKSEAK